MSQLRNTIEYLLDMKFVNAVYRYVHHRQLNWLFPTRYSEKLTIYKIWPVMEKLAPYADKFAVRPYVTQAIGEEYLVPLLGVYDSPDEIEFSSLPKKFVLKATHGSGWNIFCNDKKTFNEQEAKEKLGAWLGQNFYEQTRERQYKHMKPRIVAEAFLEERPHGVTEYKIFCFAGQPKYVRVQAERSVKIKKSFYDLNWNLMPLSFIHNKDYIAPPAEIDRPKNLEKMLELAQKLAQPFPFVRVDMYNIHGKIYFSELTFTPNNGYDIFHPDFYDKEFGKMIDLDAWKKFSG